MTACANRQSVTVAPSTNMSALKNIYVVHQPKDKDQINVLIADNLRMRGVTATTGDGPAPANVDAVITYIDKWMWDITMYLLQLTVTVREPKVRDVRAVAHLENEEEKEVHLIANITGLTVDEIDDLGLKDYRQLQKELQDFLS